MKNITYLLIGLLIFSSCTEKLDSSYKGNSANRLLVDGLITTDTTAHKIILGRTFDLTSNGPKAETDATVTISDGEALITLEEVEDGVYVTDSMFYGVIGKTYTLNIKLQDGEEYTANSYMRDMIDIDSFKVVREYFSFADMEFYYAYFYGQEPEEKGNAYMFNLFINDSLYNDTISETSFVDDELYNGNYITDADIYWIDTSLITTDTTWFTMEMLSIPADYYTYLEEAMQEAVWRGSPWDPLPANVKTNISNGAVGYFYCASKAKKTIQYIKSVEEVGPVKVYGEDYRN